MAQTLLERLQGVSEKKDVAIRKVQAPDVEQQKTLMDAKEEPKRGRFIPTAFAPDVEEQDGLMKGKASAFDPTKLGGIFGVSPEEKAKQFGKSVKEGTIFSDIGNTIKAGTFSFLNIFPTTFKLVGDAVRQAAFIPKIQAPNKTEVDRLVQEQQAAAQQRVATGEKDSKTISFIKNITDSYLPASEARRFQEDITKGSFDEFVNSTVNKLDKKVLDAVQKIKNPLIQASVGGSLSAAQSLGIAFLTKNPTFAIAALTAQETSEFTKQLRKKGVQPLEALIASVPSGIINFKLEKLGFDAFFKGGSGREFGRGMLNQIAKAGTWFARRVLPEAGQEVLQNVANNIASIATYDPDRDVFDGWFESLIGGLSGGATGASIVSTVDKVQKNKLVKDIQEKTGVSKETATEAADGMAREMGKSLAQVGNELATPIRDTATYQQAVAKTQAFQEQNTVPVVQTEELQMAIVPYENGNISIKTSAITDEQSFSIPFSQELSPQEAIDINAAQVNEWANKQLETATNPAEIQKLNNIIEQVNQVTVESLESATIVSKADEDILKPAIQKETAKAPTTITEDIRTQELTEAVDVAKSQSRKTLLSEAKSLESVVKTAARTGGRISVSSQKAALQVLNNFDFVQMRPRTVTKLKALEKAISEDESLSPSVRAGMAKQVARLSKFPIKKLTDKQLAEFNSTLRNIIETGKIQLQGNKEIAQESRQEALTALVESSHDVDPKGGQAIANLKLNALEFIPNAFFMNTIDGNARFDGENVKRVMDLARKDQASTIQTSTTFKEAKDKVRTVMGQEEIQFTPSEEAYLTAIARFTEGEDAITAHILETNLDIKTNEGDTITLPKKIGNVSLKQGEQIVKIVQDATRQREAELASTFEAINNRPMALKPNFVMQSFQSKQDAKTLRENATDIEDTANRDKKGVDTGVRRKRRNVNDKFTVPRVDFTGARIPRTDFFQQVFQTLQNRNRYIDLQPTIKETRSLIEDPAYRKKAGDVAVDYWTSILNTMARGGTPDGKVISAIDSIRNGLIFSKLGFNLTSALIQPFAVGEALPMADMVFGQDFDSSAIKKAVLKETKAMFTPGSLKEAKVKAIAESNAVASREASAGDVSIQEFLGDETGDITTAYDKANKWGSFVKATREKSLNLLEDLDIRAAGAVQLGVKKSLVAQGVSEQEAQDMADNFVNLTQASTSLALRPLAYSAGSISKALMTFQSFASNLFAMKYMALYKSGIKKGIQEKDFKLVRQSAKNLSLLVAIAIIGDVMREAIRNAIQLKTEDEKYDPTFWKRVLDNTIGDAPVIGDPIVGFLTDGNMELTNPVSDTLYHAGRGAVGLKGEFYKIMFEGGFDDESGENILRDSWKLTEQILSAAGVGGTNQASQVLKGIMSGLFNGDDRQFDRLKAEYEEKSRGLNSTQKIKLANDLVDGYIDDVLADETREEKKKATSKLDKKLAQFTATEDEKYGKIAEDLLENNKTDIQVRKLINEKEKLSKKEFRKMENFLLKHKVISSADLKAMDKKLADE